MSCRIAVCDDNPIDAAYVEKLLNIWAHEREIYVSVETFPSAEAFLFCYEEDKAFDFLLLDIEMGAMDGVALGRRSEFLSGKSAIWMYAGTMSPFTGRRIIQ